jgi:FlaA1/EpsC-like NDP-sugar epimerase
MISSTFVKQDLRRAVIVGSDTSGEGLARQIHAKPRLQYRIVGFLDPDKYKRGLEVGGIPVLGKPEEASQIALALGVQDVLVISGSLAGRHLRKLMEQCDQSGLTLKVLPAVDHLLNGHHGNGHHANGNGNGHLGTGHRNGQRRLPVRDVNINDLLRRDPIELDSQSISRLVKGRTVLITGAGGSIGSEICRQVLRFQPRALVMVERAENNLFQIHQELRSRSLETRVLPCIGDVTDKRRMSQLFRCYSPEVVFHAAAHKHVPMMEDHPGEAIKNNVFGTKRLADLAHQYRVESFVLISTDKAVKPSSIMGVSKQLAERYVHAMSQVSTTRFVVVRFGNVLGSAGSVVPLFQEQISCGGPITITHPEMERFFMTIPEASQLVLQAAAMGQGGEIFVLEMGEPVKIVDLAQDLIRLSGLAPDDIEIKFTGLRPGEKLHEELYLAEEETRRTPHPKVRVAYHRPYALAQVRNSILDLGKILHRAEPIIRRKLKEMVPEYSSPASSGQPLVV